jgi:hypothetical protein
LLMLKSVFQNFQERKMLIHILIGKSEDHVWFEDWWMVAS